MFEQIAYAANEAPAQAGPAQNPIHFFVMLGVMFMIMYFLIIRPQQKRSEEVKKMVENLKKGDRVITSGGIIGTITGVQNDYVVIKTGDDGGTKMEVLKSAITGLRA